jgi:hypothetical protein
MEPLVTYKASINVTNVSGKEIIFHLEPWGEQIRMPPGETFTVSGDAEEEGSFEVEYGEGEIIVWAWPSAIAKVFCNGKELGGLAGKERPSVPAMPAGKSVSSFLRFMLGKEIKKGGN